jgi:hypothetical protein
LPQTNSTLTDKGALKYASPTANAERAKGAVPVRQNAPFVAGRSPAPGAFSNFSPFRGGTMEGLGPQSFVTQGFSGKNAELALKKLGYDVREVRNIATRAVRLDQEAVSHVDNRILSSGMTFGSVRPVQREEGAEGARIALQTAGNRGKNAPAAGNAARATDGDGLGFLAAKFESGDEGIAAIGYDGKGGTSYGKYQIASRVGTMSAFLNYLESKAPDFALRLKAAGPANTGGRSGKMPAEWRKIASEEPERFETLQSDFIRTSHFEPALHAIAAATGVAFEKLPSAYQEVLFSTAVQHGPSGATRIVSQALQRVESGKLHNEKNASSRKAGEQLISHIYQLRANQFVSSTARVQSSVRNRLKQEMREAIQMI